MKLRFVQSNWLAHGIARQFLLFYAATMLFTALICAAWVMSTYHQQLSLERQQASAAINRLLQTSLENAMLKQDWEGLRHIVEKLGQQEDVVQVFISNPAREIRFASESQRLYTKIEWPAGSIPQAAATFFLRHDDGQEVLRSVNPVYNKPECERCHGLAANNPINGVVFVDYSAGAIRANARQTGMQLAGLGLLAIALTGGLLGWFMRIFVLRPVARLAEASRALADGQWDTRVEVAVKNELGALAGAFNHMAENLQRGQARQREQEHFLQALIDAVPDGLRVITRDYRVERVNLAFCEQLQLPREAILAVPCHASSQQRAEPCPASLVSCPLSEVQPDGRPVKTLSYYHRQDGSMLPVEIIAAPMRVEINGQPMEFVVESVRDLDQAVWYSHEQKLAAMGQLAAGIAHEIHNPLTSVRLALQASLRALRQGEGDPDKIAHYLQLVDQEVDHCIQVTHRLLKLSTPRGESRQLVDVNAIMRDITALLGHECQQRHVVVHSELMSGELRFHGYDNDLRIVVLNLMQNALHAMPHGGEIYLRSWCEGPRICFSVRDTGIGIGLDILPRIFDPFFSRRADGEKGTGLGLNICKALVQQHQGQLHVESSQGQGAIFTVYLPDPQHADNR